MVFGGLRYVASNKWATMSMILMKLITLDLHFIATSNIHNDCHRFIMIPVTTPFLLRLTILRSLLKRLPRPSTEGQQGANREGQGDLPLEVMCPTHPMMSTKRG